jgi:uncharacterized protein
MTESSQEQPVVDNTAESRFEQRIGDDIAIAEYKRRGDVIVFTHTLVPPHLEGRGIASGIAKFALDQARAQGLKVDPRCRFFAGYIERNPGYKDLLRSNG